MQLVNLNNSYFLKQNDTATQIKLGVLDYEGNPFPLDTAEKIEVVIGVEEGRVLVKEASLLSGIGEIEFGLDEGDIIPAGDNRLEVHIYTSNGEKHVVPSKGYYKLRVQKPIDDLDVQVTTYTLDYFLDQVNKITEGLPETIQEAQRLTGQIQMDLDEVAQLKVDAQEAANLSHEARDVANQIIDDMTTVKADAEKATTDANLAATNATNAANNANIAADNANLAAERANDEADYAKLQGDYAKAQGDYAKSQAELIDDILDQGSVVAVNGKTGNVILTAEDVNAIPVSEKGVVGGVARLNEEGKVVDANGNEVEGKIKTVNNVEPDVNGNIEVSISWSEIKNKPSTFTPTAHTHVISEITDLETVLNSKASKETLETLEQLFNKITRDFVSVNQFGLDKNSATIQAALDYAKNIGGVEILVPSGEYVIYEPLKIPSNTKIRGLGEVIFKRASDVATAIILNDSDGTIGGYDASKNIEIENIIFDSNNAEIEGYVTALGIGHAQNIKIKDCTFLNNTTWHDIEINGCKNVLIDNCDFPNYQGTTEMLQLDAMINEGVFPWFGPADKTPCENVVINRCRFNALNVTVRAIGNHTYESGVTSKHVIVNNCEFVGFATTISLLDVIDFYVNECKFIDCKTAIAWSQAQNDICNWVFSRNSYRSTVGYIDEARFFYGFTNAPTLEFSNIYFIDNYIDGAPSHGIAFTPTGKVIIKGNHIRNCGKSGIFIYGGDDIIIEGNTLEGNNIRQEPARADIVLGNNGNVAVNNAIVTNNIVETIINGTNTNGVKIYNNIVKNTLQDNSPSTSDIRGNTVAGVIGDEWKQLGLLNGWVHATENSLTKYFKTDDNIVHLQIAMKDGTPNGGTVIGVLPIGYRPNQSIRFTVLDVTNGVLRHLYITSTGNIAIQSIPSVQDVTGTWAGYVTFKADL